MEELTASFDKHDVFVEALLESVQSLKGRTTYRGDYSAVDTLIDLKEAIEQADLTDRQREALRLVFGEDLTQGNAGKKMGIRQNTVSENVTSSISKIANIYRHWEELDNEIQST